ncbi:MULTISPECIES: three-Cys-motif partner protein TcmP [unclassified Bradyrhizobium]|uniref:three-Cys-motif partner protein TcmP n=1 Tax=unclassified Bradyrhizobium TaxID=2631580 RepID=UPI0028EAF793|nr:MULTISPECIES: three-Cys-motif partner protein TcmP [unclassified Bradyrhizobium]
MAQGKFFDERTDQSEVKARIVQKYFYAWAKVIIPSAKQREKKIAYIDLYAGPGRYKDGAASTPLMILERAIADPDLKEMLVTVFNDADQNHTSVLQTEIDKLAGIETLTYKPHVSCGEIDEEASNYFGDTNLVPSFSFVDPFGYKGLSLKIVNGVIKDWGCDCVFFFNYNRINAGISNPAVKPHMDALFGEDRAEKLRKLLPERSPQKREELILEELAQAIKVMGGKYVLPFRFKNGKGTRTSHSLIFVSKHFKGYEIMKDIMAKESSVMDQGVPSFTYSPADASTPLLFSLARPFESLKDDLKKAFSGKTLSMQQVYEQHSVDTPFIKRNYKDALLTLEADEKIRAEPAKRKKGTFADHVMVAFP